MLHEPSSSVWPWLGVRPDSAGHALGGVGEWQPVTCTKRHHWVACKELKVELPLIEYTANNRVFFL